MAYVPVPKDLTRVKSKFLFNLTKRQVICFGLGAIVGLPVFFLTRGTIGASAASFLMIVLMLPFFLFAMYEQHGQPMEVVLRHFIQARFIRPRQRIYQTENFYAVIDRNVRTQNEVNLILHGKKEQGKADAGGKAAAEGADGTPAAGTEEIREDSPGHDPV